MPAPVYDDTDYWLVSMLGLRMEMSPPWFAEGGYDSYATASHLRLPQCMNQQPGAA